MTICIAAKYDDGVVCMSDTKISYGNNCFAHETIKGQWRFGSFVMWSGDVWAAQKAIDHDEVDFLSAVRTLSRKHHGEHKTPEFPVEFIEVTQDGLIKLIEGSGSVFRRNDYAVIGHGCLQGWGLMDALYKGGTESAVKRQLAKVLRITDRYDNTVNNKPKYETVRVLF
jgi:ATP-dependent protease HslVU (ClpYQ) peptidase subunit